MSLTIQPTKPRDGAHRFGGTLTGTLRFSSKKLEPVQTLSLSFMGQSSTTIKSNQANGLHTSVNRLSNKRLFEQQLVLHQGDTQIGTGEHVWSFSFPIPTHAQDHDTTMKSQKLGYSESKTQLLGLGNVGSPSLPASFKHRGRNKCSVEYKVEARLIRPDSAHRRGKQDLACSRAVDIRHRERSPETSSLSSEDSRASSETFRLKRSVSSSSLTHRLEKKCRRSKTLGGASGADQLLSNSPVALSMEVPDCIAAKSSKPVEILLRAKRGSEEKQNQDAGLADDVELRSFAIDLVQHTAVRAGASDHVSSESRILPLTRGSGNFSLSRHMVSNTQDARMIPTPSTLTSLSFDKWPRAPTPKTAGSDNGSYFPRAPTPFDPDSARTSPEPRVSRNKQPAATLDIGSRIRDSLDWYRTQSPSAIAPEFATSNCFRAYTLRVQVTCSHGNKLHKYEMNKIPICLIAEEKFPYTQTRNLQESVTVLGGLSEQGISRSGSELTLGLREESSSPPPSRKGRSYVPTKMRRVPSYGSGFLNSSSSVSSFPLSPDTVSPFAIESY